MFLEDAASDVAPPWKRMRPMMMRVLLLLLSLLAATASLAGNAPPRNLDSDGVRIGILVNNVPSAPGFETAWGFAAVIKGLEQNLLCDTGGDGALLLANMARMGIDPGEIDVVLLSHVHGDHTRGLGPFLRRNPNVTVFMPASFPRGFQSAVRESGARVVLVQAPTSLFEGAYSTGPMGHAPDEQALVLDTDQGLVILTGCAHPGVVEMVREAKRRHGKPIRLVLGGFHLLQQPERDVLETVSELKGLGVSQVAPSHCTGDRATALFRDAWGADFLDGGCGAVIELGP
jgi:7,8-dihydropterin-6-yl-methyl-4-(beta-D-ribofuranosyl)aminobenzene 5'-phosphate synthase